MMAELTAPPVTTQRNNRAALRFANILASYISK
jgi:hypothetical protein